SVTSRSTSARPRNRRRARTYASGMPTRAFASVARTATRTDRDRALRVSALTPRFYATGESRGEAALFHHLVPPLVRRSCFQAVQPRARLLERGVAVPRLPILPALPGAYDHTVLRLVDRPQQLAGHPAGAPLGRAQTLVHRPVPLALGPRFELHVRDDGHHGARPPVIEGGANVVPSFAGGGAQEASAY